MKRNRRLSHGVAGAEVELCAFLAKYPEDGVARYHYKKNGGEQTQALQRCTDVS